MPRSRTVKICACGCGKATRGGTYLPGHNSKTDRHWSRMRGESKDVSVYNNMKRRKAKAYDMLAKNETNKDFTTQFFRFFNRIRDVRPDAEMEAIVLTDTGYRSIDVGIVSLLLGFEYDPGNRYHLGTVKDTAREKLLEAEGWKIVHCKGTPDWAVIRRAVAEREAELAGNR